jgi:hypothetical protein
MTGNPGLNQIIEVKKVFSSPERKYLLNKIKPYLTKKHNNNTMHGLSTGSDLYQISDFRFYIDKIKTAIEKKCKEPLTIFKAWCRYTEGDHLNFHNHPPMTLTSIYYLSNPSALGTLIKVPGRNIVGGKENSLVCFDGSIYHSVPQCSKKIKRYTFIVDFQTIFK